jgi:hypothetical protein
VVWPDSFFRVNLRNESQSLDSWSGTKKSGLCCFKLKERLHEFLGNGIFYCPSSADVEAVDEDRLQSALEWIQELHTKRPLTEYKETKEVDKEDVELTVRSLVFFLIFLLHYLLILLAAI